MNKLLCIGEALIDMICTDKGKPLSEGQQFLKKPGGAPTNVAAAIGALGGNVALAAKVGNDPFGEHLVDTMQKFNVDTRWMLKDPKYFTTLAFVSLMENGERDFYFNRGADGQLTVEETGSIDLSDFSIVHFGSATAFLPGPLQTAYHSLFKKCRQQKIFTSFDPNYRHLLFEHNKRDFIDQSWSLMQHCSLFKSSDEEALLLTGERTVEDAAKMLLKRTNAVITITMGAQGTLLGIKGKTILVPSIKIDPVDTTGAGDAFTGATLYELSCLSMDEIHQLNEKQWAEMIFKANQVGARTCEHMGAMEAFQYLRG